MVTKLLLRATALLLLVSSAVVAQVTYTAVPEESNIWVDGSSNHGEFNVYSDEFTVEAVSTDGASAEDPGLASIVATLAAKGVTSRRSVIMDKLTHNAFKAVQNPDITYELSSAEVGEDGILKTTGNLTLAGFTKEIEMDVTFNLLDDGRVHFVGSHAFNMTEYEIEPPTALFGRFRVNDAVVVHFDLTMAAG